MRSAWPMKTAWPGSVKKAYPVSLFFTLDK